MSKSVVKTLRLNPKTEKELYEFVNLKGGVKKALLFLFNEYKINKRVDTIIDRIKLDLGSLTPINVAEETVPINKDDEFIDLLDNFM